MPGPPRDRVDSETASTQIRKENKRRLARYKAEDVFRERAESGESQFKKAKTKADMMASNIAGTIKNMGGGY